MKSSKEIISNIVLKVLEPCWFGGCNKPAIWFSIPGCENYCDTHHDLIPIKNQVEHPEVREAIKALDNITSNKNEVKQYLISLMTCLGQMDHIAGKVQRGEESISYNQNGFLSMSAENRRELLDRGWSLISKIDKGI